MSTKNDDKPNMKRRQAAVTAMRELANRIERGELRIVSQGLYPGVTPNIWNFHLEMVDVESVEVLREN